MNSSVVRIALIGPESTGKTTLSKSLADHFKTEWVPEYARDYITFLRRPYTAEDILFCAAGQEKTEDEKIKTANQILFSDTEGIIAAVWLMESFQVKSDWLEHRIPDRRFDLYLLTSPDLPFEADPVRENPHRRVYLFERYRQELEKRNFLYEIISGTGPARLALALQKVNEFLEGIQRKI